MASVLIVAVVVAIVLITMILLSVEIEVVVTAAVTAVTVINTNQLNKYIATCIASNTTINYYNYNE